MKIIKGSVDVDLNTFKISSSTTLEVTHLNYMSNILDVRKYFFLKCKLVEQTRH